MEYKQYKTKLIVLEQENDKLKNIQQELKNEITGLTQLITTYKSSVKDKQQRDASRIMSLTQKWKQLKREKEMLEQNKSMISTTLDHAVELQSQYKRQQKNNSHLIETESAKLQSMLDEMKKETKQLKNENKELNEQLEEYRKMINSHYINTISP